MSAQLALTLDAQPRRMKASAAHALGLLERAGSNGVTRLEAIHAGSGNFPARVEELRAMGYHVGNVWVGNGRTRYVRYVLEGER